MVINTMKKITTKITNNLTFKINLAEGLLAQFSLRQFVKFKVNITHHRKVKVQNSAHSGKLIKEELDQIYDVFFP